MRIDFDVDYRSLANSQSDLEALPNRFVHSVLIRAARQLKRDAPKAFSVLTNSGGQRLIGSGQGEVFFGTNYARDVHEGREPGPVSFQSIKDWVRVKGIDRRAAWPIARSIEQNGTVPQPWVREFVESGELRKVIRLVAAEEANRVA